MISIIVPVYNTEKYLNKCIESIISQTYKDLEIILIDDGSTDNSGNICDKYKASDSRIHVIHQENKGLSVARNTGIDYAHGEYITFIDSDDYIEFDTFEDVNYAIQKFNPDLIFFREKSVNEIGQTIYINGSEPSGEIKQITKKNAEDLIIKELINGMCDKVYRAEIVKSIRFHEGKMYGEDYMYNLVALTKVEKVAYIDRIKYSYVSNSNSVTHKKFNKNSFDQVFFKDEIQQYISVNFPEYDILGKKQSFLARLRIMRPIYYEKLQRDYNNEILLFSQEMKKMFHQCKAVLSSKEIIEYYLFCKCKLLYHIFLKFIYKHKM